jgi:protein-tyrosine phosphatase
MAEALARRYALERGFAIETRSGGVMGLEGRPADSNAIAVLQEIGVDLGLHKSAGLDEETLAWADWILVMELDHARRIRELSPSAEDRTLMLGSFGGLVGDVSDPMGSWKWRFRKTRDELQRCVHAFMDQLSTRE